MFMSETVEWGTPQHLFDGLHSEFDFTLDPCATADNAKCAKFFTVEDDGLSKSWGGERVFMNPPYGRQIKHWMKKAWEESQKGALVVCLIPSRTDTKWWHDFAMKGEVRFIKGRLYFNDGEGRAPFPSAIVILTPHRKDHEAISQSKR
jgi:site-specific DNA-methyltransferase (adenine-specific)